VHKVEKNKRKEVKVAEGTFRPTEADQEIFKERFAEPKGETKAELSDEKEKLQEVTDADLLGDKTDMSMVKTYSSRGTIFPYREHEIDRQLKVKIQKIDDLLKRIEEESNVTKEGPQKVTVTTTGSRTGFSRNVVRSAEEYLGSLGQHKGGNRRRKKVSKPTNKSKKVTKADSTQRLPSVDESNTLNDGAAQ